MKNGQPFVLDRWYQSVLGIPDWRTWSKETVEEVLVATATTHGRETGVPSRMTEAAMISGEAVVVVDQRDDGLREAWRRKRHPAG